MTSVATGHKAVGQQRAVWGIQKLHMLKFTVNPDTAKKV